MAAQHGNIAAVKFLLNHGASANIQSELEGTPLIIASKSGHSKVVDILCKARWVELDARDHANQRTALSYATQFNFVEVVRLLLAAGADPNIQGIRGRSSFSLAAGGSNRSIVELFLRSDRVDYNTKDIRGYSALTHAEAERQYLWSKGQRGEVLDTRKYVIGELKRKGGKVDQNAVREALEIRKKDNP